MVDYRFICGWNGSFFHLSGRSKKMDILIEAVGYLGMALVLLSMAMTKVERLRWLNLSGSVFCIIYGICTNTWPTALLNLGLAAINTIQLIRLKKK
jgi:hypothetical protein